MSEIKHTPGKFLDRRDEDGGAFVTGGGHCIANMVGPAENRHGNARLFAATPDLLEALKGLLSSPTHEGWQGEAADAIAKAEGRS